MKELGMSFCWAVAIIVAICVFSFIAGFLWEAALASGVRSEMLKPFAGFIVSLILLTALIHALRKK